MTMFEMHHQGRGGGINPFSPDGSGGPLGCFDPVVYPWPPLALASLHRSTIQCLALS